MSESKGKSQPLSGYGEFELINQYFRRALPGNQKDVTGIGDDCAILPLYENSYQLVTTDMLLEETHFIKNSIQAEDLGYKALAVNFSDISAMGGTPTGIFLSLGLPENLQLNWLNNFMNGFFELCEKYKVPLLGGDTTRSPRGLIINVMVLGKVKKKNVKRRTGSRSGDKICVTEYLGDSAAGLSLLTDGHGKKLNNRESQNLIQRHQRPPHSLEEGQWLGQNNAVHSMIDISDGIGSDLIHLIEKSDLGIDIHLDQLPVSEALVHLSKTTGNEIYEYAVNGGEDYGLLITVDPSVCNDVKKSFESTFGKPLFEIGEVTKEHTGVNYTEKGINRKFEGKGFNHFN